MLLTIELIDSTVVGDSQTGQLVLRLVLAVEDFSYPPPPLVKINLQIRENPPLELRAAIPVTILNFTTIYATEERVQESYRSLTNWPMASNQTETSLSWKEFRRVLFLHRQPNHGPFCRVHSRHSETQYLLVRS